MNWKEQLIHARSLMGKAGVIAYDRAVVLKEVFENDDFRADSGDDMRSSRRLDEYVNDLCLTFLDLLQLLKHYPTRKQWASGKLRSMYDAMTRQVYFNARPWRKQRQAANDSKLSLPSVAIEAAESVPLTIERLTCRIRELERENSELRARIEELEQLAIC